MGMQGLAFVRPPTGPLSTHPLALSTFHAAGVLLFCVAFGPSVGVGVVGVGEVGTGVAGAVGELGTAGVGAAGLGGWALAFSFARTSMNT